MVYLAASTGSVATVASSVTTSDQTFQLAGSPVTVAGQVLAAKLPLPANSKIVALNMPAAQGGREHKRHPFLPVWPQTCWNGWNNKEHLVRPANLPHDKDREHGGLYIVLPLLYILDLHHCNHLMHLRSSPNLLALINRGSPAEGHGHFPVWASCKPSDVQHTTSYDRQHQPQSQQLCLHDSAAGTSSFSMYLKLGKRLIRFNW